MDEAYAYSGIRPDEFWNYTPAELEFMTRIDKVKLGIEEPRQPMSNPEMMEVVQAISDTMKYYPERGIRGA